MGIQGPKSKIVGILKNKYLLKLKIKNCNCKKVFLNPGVKKHIKQRHPGDYRKYFKDISKIVSSPDYIGINSKHSKNSIEMVKSYKDEDLLLAITINNNGYLYISSLYDIGNDKVDKRLNSGRLIRVR